METQQKEGRWVGFCRKHTQAGNVCQAVHTPYVARLVSVTLWQLSQMRAACQEQEHLNADVPDKTACPQLPHKHKSCLLQSKARAGGLLLQNFQHASWKLAKSDAGRGTHQGLMLARTMDQKIVSKWCFHFSFSSNSGRAACPCTHELY